MILVEWNGEIDYERRRDGYRCTNSRLKILISDSTKSSPPIFL